MLPTMIVGRAWLGKRYSPPEHLGSPDKGDLVCGPLLRIRLSLIEGVLESLSASERVEKEEG